MSSESVIPGVSYNSRNLEMPAIRKEGFQQKRPLEQVLRSAARQTELAFGRLFRSRRLTHEQWAVLATLRERPSATASQIALAHCFDAGSLSRAIEVLVWRGLVGRERSQDDRRIVTLSLTIAGNDLLRTLQPDVDAAWNALLKGFTKPEIRFLTNSLERLSHAMAANKSDCPSRKIA